jgi:hypothetical protein
VHSSAAQELSEGADHPRPPFETLSEDERAEVVSVVARLTGSSQQAVEEEMNELDMGQWDKEMAGAATRLSKRVKIEQRGKVVIKVADTAHRIAFWLRKATRFPIIGRAAVRLLSMHASTAAAERNWSAWGRVYTSLRNRLSLEVAQKMVFVKANTDPSTPEHSVEVALKHLADG